MKRVALYVGLCAALAGVLALLAVLSADGRVREAIWVSATLAFIVQMIAFMFARLFPPSQVMVGWGLGAMLRLMAVVMYGVFVAKVWGAPIAPALLSLAGLLFVTTIVEPVFLKR